MPQMGFVFLKNGSIIFWSGVDSSQSMGGNAQFEILHLHQHPYNYTSIAEKSAVALTS